MLNTKLQMVGCACVRVKGAQERERGEKVRKGATTLQGEKDNNEKGIICRDEG